MADKADAVVTTPGDDWPAQAADTIVRVVGSVRDKTTGPAVKVARGAVYGMVAAILGIAILVLLSVAAVRMVDAYLPDALFGDTHTWAADLVVGGVFVIAGAVCWARRGPRHEG